MNYETAQKVAQAGAERITAGSTIFKSEDIRNTIAELENLNTNVI